ncbi:BamA/TamA family outer membrane protein [Synechococcus sp. A15-28]|uniref:BamA/TamA family outer membrane protein n=1 Tax=Synechococcus sp. A15-28 TaxID=1050638 RepID=UPI0016481ACD|nr:BamA/TamA family outer membrane protein [Synechococcus sp. A15-28]QNI41606.1 outer membrane protein insertion porin family [Synechococcus sp. A15-28]
MTRRRTRRSPVAVGQGLLGLALGLPLTAAPLLAQEVDVNTDPVNVLEVAAPRVLISEVIIEGISGHPEEERLQVAAYGAMQVRPGSRVTREELQRDLNAIQATGWFSDVRINPVNGPLGVQVVVQVEPFPTLSSVELDPVSEELPEDVLEEIFSPDYGRTLNLNDLQTRMKELQGWYAEQGYSLARISGPERVSPEGVVTLKLIQGRVADVEVQFLNKEGDATDENGDPIGGKTKEWVITREISVQPGDTFNRNRLEKDIKRLYGTQLFSDVKVTLKPVPEEPGDVVIVLGIVEQSTGQLSGGLGYSQSQGVFGQVQLQDSNFFGRAWNVGLNVTYGQYGGLTNLNFTDPWIKGDRHRTSFRGSLFLSQQVPQVFQSEDSGNIRTIDGYEDNGNKYAYDVGRKYQFSDNQKVPGLVNRAEKEYPNRSWFDYEGDSFALRKTGGSIAFTRPLNGGDPFKDTPWRVLAGLSLSEVRPINFAADSRVYGVSTRNFNDGRVKNKDIICVSYNCADSNLLTGVRFATTYNNFNNPRNPTSGNFFTASTEQFIGVNEDSPTFNRLRGSYTQFFPVKWLKLHKKCRPKPGEVADCPQAIGFQVKAGTIIGDLPPYEAFCMGGSNSIRGWYDCDLAVARSFGEVTLEYRFPIISVFSGELFVDAGTDFNTQKNVPGKPGLLLNKDGSGVSVGTGVIVGTPVGPLRLEVASKDFTEDWRFNLGVGWKF